MIIMIKLKKMVMIIKTYRGPEDQIKNISGKLIRYKLQKSQMN